jgi:hypothetical protein
VPLSPEKSGKSWKTPRPAFTGLAGNLVRLSNELWDVPLQNGFARITAPIGHRPHQYLFSFLAPSV